MNPAAHRLVFNRRRGCRLAVAGQWSRRTNDLTWLSSAYSIQAQTVDIVTRLLRTP